MSYEQIERVACNVRSQLVPGLAAIEALPVADLFEKLDEYTVVTSHGSFQMDYAVKQITALAEARYDERTRRILIQLSPESYDELGRDVPRARHTVSHEIGHGVLHAGQLLRMSTLPHARLALERATEHQFCEDTEWQADSFAAALLMPAVGMRHLELTSGSLTVTQLQDRFQVSFESASYRLDNYQARRAQLLK